MVAKKSFGLQELGDAKKIKPAASLQRVLLRKPNLLEIICVAHCYSAAVGESKQCVVTF